MHGEQMSVDTVEFSYLTVEGLKKECIKRQLDTSGLKNDLIGRLEGYSKDEGEVDDNHGTYLSKASPIPFYTLECGVC